MKRYSTKKKEEKAKYAEEKRNSNRMNSYVITCSESKASGEIKWTLSQFFFFLLKIERNKHIIFMTKQNLLNVDSGQDAFTSFKLNEKSIPHKCFLLNYSRFTLPKVIFFPFQSSFNYFLIYYYCHFIFISF